MSPKSWLQTDRLTSAQRSVAECLSCHARHRRTPRLTRRTPERSEQACLRSNSESIVDFGAIGARLTEDALVDADEAKVEDVDEVLLTPDVPCEARDFPLIVVERVADARVLQPVGPLREKWAVQQVKELVALIVGAELQIESSVPQWSLVVRKGRKCDVWRERQLVAMIENQIRRNAADVLVGVDFRLQQAQRCREREIVERFSQYIAV